MTTSVAAWKATTIYTAGMEATENGIVYRANWWTSGNDPFANNGISGSGQPWTVVSAAVVPSQPPTVPTSVAAGSTTSTATVLTWVASTVPGGGAVTDYLIYENGQKIGISTGTSFAVSGLAPSAVYSFSVVAEDAAGDSAQSATITITTMALGLPSTPASFIASNTTSNTTTLTWGAATVAGGTVTDYVVYENGVKIGTTTTPSYAVTGLVAATTYKFTVLAEDAAGSSPQSQAISVTTANASVGILAPAWSAVAVYTGGMQVSENGSVYKANWWTTGNDPLTSSGGPSSGQPWTLVGTAAPPLPVPTVPGSLVASATTSGATTLAWKAATVPGGSVTDYIIYENGTAVMTTTATSFTINGLSPSTTYSFAVAAEDSSGISPLSAPVGITTGVLPPSTGGNGYSLALSGKIFAPYIDMGMGQDADLVGISKASGIKNFTLAFVQSSGNNTVGWSGVGTLTSDMLQNGQTIQQEIRALRAIGGDVILSFGGSSGVDPAAAASSVAALQAQYQGAIDRYGLTSLDFDIEGSQVADTHSMILRDQALVALKIANPHLAISFTLPVLPTGLDSNGVNVINVAKSYGLMPDVINIMAMDYGSSVDNGGAMGNDAILAAQATMAQISAAGLTSKIGITAMIGVNDTPGEIFSLADAQQLETWAAGNQQVSRLSMWSVARDNGSGAGHAYAACDSSSIAQSNWQFASILGKF